MKRVLWFIGILIFLLMTTKALAWWSVPSIVSSTHYKVTGDALSKLTATDYPDMQSQWFGPYIKKWTSGPNDDAAAHGGTAIPNGGDWQSHWTDALTQYKSINFASGDRSAYYYIALMMHLVEDQAVAAHAYNIRHGGQVPKDHMEEMVYWHYESFSRNSMDADDTWNYDKMRYYTRDVTLFGNDQSYWRQYWLPGWPHDVDIDGDIYHFDGVYAGNPIDENPYVRWDVFPSDWEDAGITEKDLSRDLLGQASAHVAGALMKISKSLPPLVKDLDIAPSADTVPVIDKQTGNNIHIRILENRTQNVKIFITLDSPTGTPIISNEYGTGKSFSLSSGTDLPWEGTYTINWDGKLANGSYPPSGEHTLYVRVQDADGIFSPEVTHPFVIHNLGLASGYVDPPVGDANTDFYYYVYYNDPDGIPPAIAYVYIDGTPHAMTLYGGSASDGSYIFGPIKLSAASHNYFFYFADSLGGSVFLPSAGVSPGPTVTSYNLTVSVSSTGGEVAGTGINCPGDCSGSYAPNTSITLTATASVGYLFGGWEGCDSTSGTSCSVIMNSNKTISASFISAEFSGYPFAQMLSGDYDYEMRAVRQTSDGGFILAGTITLPTANNTDGWVVKLKPDGTIEWQKRYGGSGDDSFTAVEQIGDAYVIAGTTTSYGGTGYSAWVMKLDKNSSILWQKNYSGSGNDFGIAIAKASDGNYILAGTTAVGTANYDVFVCKLDKNNGSVLLRNSYGNSNVQDALDIKAASDGYIIAGRAYISSTRLNDAWIMKLNADLSVKWQFAYGGNDDDEAFSVQEITENGSIRYIVAGDTTSFTVGYYRAWVMKLDASGNIIWQNIYASRNDAYDYSIAYEIQKTTDGGYIIGGVNDYFYATSNYDAWLMKLNSSGSIAWQRAIAGVYNDAAYSVQQTSDGGYIAVGKYRFNGSSPMGIGVWRTDSAGNIGSNCSIVKQPNAYIVSSGAFTRTSISISNSQNISAGGSSASSSNTGASTTGYCSYYFANPIIRVSPTQLNFGTQSGGSSSTQTITVYNAGSSILTTATININGANASEFSLTENCSTLAPYGGTCSIAVTFSPASFGIKTASLMIYSDDPDSPEEVVLLGSSGYNLGISRSGTGAGSVLSSPAGINCGTDCSEKYNAGANITLTATPDENSIFVGWSGTACSGTGNCTLTMNADSSVTATFNLIKPVADFYASFTSGVYPLTVEFTDFSLGAVSSWSWDFGDGTTSTARNPTHTYESVGEYAVTLQVSNAAGNDAEVKSNFITVESYITRTITASAGSGGKISPSGNVGVIQGTNQTFAITPLSGYHITDVLVDGMSAGAVSTFTFTDITSNHTISASFARTTHTITASAGAGGSISPAGTLTINQGSGQTFTITPDSGFYIADVRVDGKSVGTVGTYAFTNIKSNHTIAASFSNATSHIISASAGAGGSISPAGGVSVNYGANQTFTLTPDTGYHIENVLIDGESAGAVSSYTFTNVTIGHAIEAIFSNTYTLTVSNTGPEPGTIRSAPAGIDCGVDCTEAYISGTTVILTAAPTLSSEFGGWSGACSGASMTCAVTMDSVRTVSASFVPMTKWVKTYGGDSDDRARAVRQTGDGGYIVMGYTESFGAGGFDALSMKIGKSGNIEWEKSYGGSGDEYLFSGHQTSDGGYIAAGSTGSFGSGGYDLWVLKLDQSGNIIWQNTYGGADYDEAYEVQQTSDGGYIAAGTTYSFGAGSYDAWVLKLDQNGGIVWQKTYGAGGYDEVYAVQQTSDGGFIISGTTWLSSIGSYAAWILKLDANGNVQWQKTYSGVDPADSIRQTADGGYIAIGRASEDVWIVKLNQNGAMEWQKVYGGDLRDRAYDVQQTSDSGYIVAGSSLSFSDGDKESWVFKLGPDGAIQWEKTYGNGDDNYARSVRQTADGGYIIAGTTESWIASWDDFMVLKVDGNGNVGGYCEIEGTSNAAVVSGNAATADTAVTGLISAGSSTPSAAAVMNISMTEGELCNAAAPDISVSSNALDFGRFEIGNSKTLSLTVANTGASALSVNSISFTGVNANEFIQTNNCTSIAIGGSCTIKVSYISVFPGFKTASMAISSNDPDTPVMNVTLSGITGRILTITKYGIGTGTIISSPGDIDCGAECKAAYNQGTDVTLTALPDEGSIFAGWSGGGCSGTGDCTITITEDTTVNAKFTFSYCSLLPVRISGATPTYYSSLQAAYDAAANGDVIQSLGINFVGDLSVNRDISVTLEGGYRCDYTASWEKTTLQGMMTTSAGKLTVSNLELVADSPDAVHSVVATSDSGGTISPSGTTNVQNGASLTYTLTPNTGYHLTGLRLDGVSVDPVPVDAYTLSNITTNHTLDAIFLHARLLVVKTGTGSGSVTSSPAGISCGTDCTENMPVDTVVTLAAAPDTGSFFAGWSGGCSGTDPCPVTMNADTTVTATFNITPPVADFSCSPTAGIETLTVNCTDLSINNPTSWLWDFGDGATSTLQNPLHTYSAIGNYTVSLTATNIGGSNTATKTNYIAVQPCPNLPVRITGATPAYYSTLQAAYDAAVDGDVIQSRNLNFVENLNVNRNISVTLEGGYSCDYTAAVGATALKGMITTSAGTLTIKDFVLVP